MTAHLVIAIPYFRNELKAAPHVAFLGQIFHYKSPFSTFSNLKKKSG